MAEKSKSNTDPKLEYAKVSQLKNNPNNPREIDKDKFQKLVKSIREFPEMLKVRPLVVNEKNEVLGGNMRLKALIELGIKEAPVVRAENFTEEQQREFIIKDNVGFGSWDWDELANEWDAEQLEDWGLDVWQDPEEEETPEREENHLKAIQIEFADDHHHEASQVIKSLRTQTELGYIGGIVLAALQNIEKQMTEKA